MFGAFSVATKKKLSVVKREVLDEKYIPVAVLDIDYSKLKDDAESSGKISQDNNGYYVERNGLKEIDLYEMRNIWVASVLKNTIYSGQYVKYIIPSTLYFTNKKTKPASIDVDFGDGNGFRTVTLNSTISIKYSDTGKINISFRRTALAAKELNNHDGTLSKVSWDRTTAVSQYLTVSNVPVYSYSFEFSATTTNAQITEGYCLDGHFEEGYDYSYWVCDEATVSARVYGTAYVFSKRTDGKFVNPIIVPEGFDPGNSNNSQYLFDKMNQEGLATQLIYNDYDIIILDYFMGGENIKANADLLEQLIVEVNKRKISKNKNIVIGPSMGGLVSRIALKNMEIKGLVHDTRLYLSFDSPHLGANISVGVQGWLKYFADYPKNNMAQTKYYN